MNKFLSRRQVLKIFAQAGLGATVLDLSHIHAARGQASAEAPEPTPTPNETSNYPFRATTHLSISTYGYDYGNRPLPRSISYWLSPDISTPLGTPTSPPKVAVRLHNAGGLDANSAYVEVFRKPLITGFLPGGDLIASGFVDIPGYASGLSAKTVELPTNLNSWDVHSCLTARVSLLIPPDSYQPENEYSPWADRHVAQRNLIISEEDAGDAIEVPFGIENPSSTSQEITISLEEVTDTNEQDLISRAFGFLLRFSEERLEPIGLQHDYNGPLGNELTYRLPGGGRATAWLAIYGLGPIVTSPGSFHVSGYHALKVVQSQSGTQVGGFTYLLYY